jgi:hypothetical protein
LRKQGRQFNEPLEAKVIKNKQLASRIAAAVALTMLVGASAFAESRPSNGTRSRGESRGVIRREHDGNAARSNRGDVSRNRAESRIEVRGTREDSRRDTARRDTARRDTDRRETNRDNATWRNSARDNSRSDSRSRGTYDRNNRNDSRSRGTYDRNHRNDSRSRSTYGSRYGNRSPFRYSGRVHRVYPYGGGYRVWLTGCQYPFFIPASYYNRSRFRVGLTINLGGFYNSRGYYDYYDDYYDNGYYDSRTSRGELRGVVESVDYRRETFVVRNDATGSFVTVVMRDRGRDPVRAGDYVELGGDWSRSGVFEAYRVDIVDYRDRR